jgi:hypothetical protein
MKSEQAGDLFSQYGDFVLGQSPDYPIVQEGQIREFESSMKAINAVKVGGAIGVAYAVREGVREIKAKSGDDGLFFGPYVDISTDTYYPNAVGIWSKPKS